MRNRILFVFLLLVSTVLLVEDIPIANYLRAVEKDRVLKTLQRDAFILAGKSEETIEAGNQGDINFVRNLITDYKQQSGARVVITDAIGFAVAVSDDEPDAEGSSYFSRPEIEKALTGEISSGTRFSTTLNLDLLFVAVPIFSGENVIGAVRLTYPAEVVNEQVQEQINGLIIVALITLLMAIFLGIILSRSVTSHLYRLESDTNKFANGDLKVRADEKSGAKEIKSLAKSFNFMAEKISQLIDKQRNFASDASHQLRTPLTAIKLRVEQAQQLLESDPKLAAERLENSLQEISRLELVVEGFLVNAKSTQITKEIQTFDLVEIVNERISNWSPLAEELSVKLKYSGPSKALVQAIDGAIEQIFDNYLDNALEVAPKNSEIRIEVIQSQTLTELRISDDGPGLSETERISAFDRNWKLRSDSSGSGLGLAIVKELLLASGGLYELAPANNGGIKAIAKFKNA